MITTGFLIGQTHASMAATMRLFDVVALTDDVAVMADYVRSAEGREAIKRGLNDIKHGRVIAGADALATELKRRAASRRKVR
jgi:hypothetical protein